MSAIADAFWNLTPGVTQQIRLVADDPFAVIVPTTQVITTSAVYTVVLKRAGTTILRSELVDGINFLLRLIQYALFPVAGLLLWQDMPLQWGYAAAVRKQAARQAREAVDLLGYHPSIAVWCGHNEPIALDIARQAGKSAGVGPEPYDVTVIPQAAVVLPNDARYPQMPD